MKAAFLDRDGTIIKDYPDNVWKYIKFPEFLDGSIEALQHIKNRGFEIIIITNQYLIGEGIITLEDYQKFSNLFLRILKQNGINVLDVFYCPHARNQNCNCIKPKPGLMNQALTKYSDIDMGGSFYVGDSICDKELAQKFNLDFYGINVECENSVESLKDVIKFVKYKNNGLRKNEMKKKFLWITCIFTATILCCLFFIKEVQDTNCKEVEIDGKTMRAHVKGSGDKTIVMLSGWGTDSPIDDFSQLCNNFSKDYKVVVLEYFGYGESDITLDERSNQVIVQEIRTALDRLNIKPPYILMPHSMSGLYSLYYANNYPSEILGIVGIDMSLPQKQLERWTEETFEEAKLIQESSDLNISMINQWNKFYYNSKELENIKYPFNLPVIAFLATEQINSVNEMINSDTMKTSWLDINKNMITNSNIQTIQILEGGHYLHHNECDEIVNISKEFIESKVK